MAVATTKTELENQLRNLKQAFYVGLAAYEILGIDEAIELLNRPPHNQIVANWIETPERRKVEREEFLKLLLRSILKEPFETIKSYCNDTNQIPLFESQDWYHFARLIRNAVSHNFRFSFSEYDKKQRLPLAWHNITLHASLDGQELTRHILGPDEAWQLVEEMHTFVTTLM